MLYIVVSTENAAPYHIIQPSSNDYIQIVYPDADAKTHVTLSCSLNVSIPVNMTVIWLRDDNHFITQTRFNRPTNTAMLSMLTKSRYDLDVFQCVFNNTAGCTVRRTITVIGK